MLCAVKRCIQVGDDMIIIKQHGDFHNLESFLGRAKHVNYYQILERYAQAGVEALAQATPVDTGLTADSWGYKITQSGSSYAISWTNSNVVKGVPIAIVLQYGHGTRNGGYVEGRDYINPALKSIFDKMASDAWKEVTG